MNQYTLLVYLFEAPCFQHKIPSLDSLSICPSCLLVIQIRRHITTKLRDINNYIYWLTDLNDNFLFVIDPKTEWPCGLEKVSCYKCCVMFVLEHTRFKGNSRKMIMTQSHLSLCATF